MEISARRHRRRAPLLACLIASLALVAGTHVANAEPARATTITFPVRLDHVFVRRVLVAEVFTLPNERARPWVDPEGCGHLTVWDPRVDAVAGRLRVRMRGEAEWGVSAGENCLFPASWEGWIELFAVPQLDPQHPVIRFHVTDSNVYGPDGRETLVASKLWDWTKTWITPRIEDATVDLRQPLAELRELLPTALPATDARQADALLRSLRLVSAKVDERALVVGVSLTAPATVTPGETAPEPPLDPAEIERFDAFLTFVVEQAALATDDARLRASLLAVLIESRRDVVAALASATPGATDPVPRLFRNAWSRLAPVVRHLESTLPGSDALRYLSFVAAGDALAALEEAGPAVGVEISSQGLRRLARIVAPTATTDPLAYGTDVDPALRARFGFGPPLPLPGADPLDLLEEPQSSLHPWPPPPSLPPVPAYASARERTVTALPALLRATDWLLPRAAYAATNTVGQVRARLANWAPSRDDVDEYLPLVRTILRSAAESTLAQKPLPAAVAPIFRPLVLATAWKETCWRQFIHRGGKVVPIQSRTGAIGIMQVDPRVWRGFYDAASLSGDILYNARAGGEILRHYLVDYAIAKGEQAKGGGSVDALARATYAAYNAGPRALSRYRRSDVPGSQRSIDAEFWKYYQAVKQGDELAVRSCYGGS